MNDSPTQPSILILNLLIITQGSAPSNSFFVTGTVLIRPGFSPTVMAPLTGVSTVGTGPTAVMPSPGVNPALPASVTPFDVLMSMPQPIS